MPVLKRFASSDDVIGVVLQDRGMRPTAYRRNARGLRDRQTFEGVRMQAGALFSRPSCEGTVHAFA
jgi:hypothetical protein